MSNVIQYIAPRYNIAIKIPPANVPIENTPSFDIYAKTVPKIPPSIKANITISQPYHKGASYDKTKKYKIINVVAIQPTNPLIINVNLYQGSPKNNITNPYIKQKIAHIVG